MRRTAFAAVVLLASAAAGGEGIDGPAVDKARFAPDYAEAKAAAGRGAWAGRFVRPAVWRSGVR